MWDVAADVKLDIEFLLLYIFYGRKRSSYSQKAIKTHENNPQILSDQSTRVSAAQR